MSGELLGLLVAGGAVVVAFVLLGFGYYAGYRAGHLDGQQSDD